MQYKIYGTLLIYKKCDNLDYSLKELNWINILQWFYHETKNFIEIKISEKYHYL